MCSDEDEEENDDDRESQERVMLGGMFASSGSRSSSQMCGRRGSDDDLERISASRGDGGQDGDSGGVAGVALLVFMSTFAEGQGHELRTHVFASISFFSWLYLTSSSSRSFFMRRA